MFLRFFFNDTPTTEIYTLSLHDALPISQSTRYLGNLLERAQRKTQKGIRSSGHLPKRSPGDRKSTRLNSSHPSISYAVFCLKKKKPTTRWTHKPRLASRSSESSDLTSAS